MEAHGRAMRIWLLAWLAGSVQGLSAGAHLRRSPVSSDARARPLRCAEPSSHGVVADQWQQRSIMNVQPLSFALEFPAAEAPTPSAAPPPPPPASSSLRARTPAHRRRAPLADSMAVMTAPPPQQQHLGAADVRASMGVVTPTKPRGRGRPKGSGGRGSPPKARAGGGGGKRSQATDAVSDFVRTIEPKRLLEHAEEIQLARAIQRLKDLEDLYYNLSSTHQQTAVEAIVAEGGASRAEWARAANISVPQLRTELREGKQARETIVERNVGLVGSLVQQLKRSSGGRLDQGITEADLVQEGCISLLRAAERFDVSMGVRFGTYATFWAKAAIKRALHEQTRVVRLPSRVQNTYGKIRRASDMLSAQQMSRGDGSGEVTDDAVAIELRSAGLKLSPERVRQVINHVKSRPSSLDQTLNAEGKNSMIDLVVDDSTRLEAGVVQSMLRRDLSAVMERHLRPEEAAVLTKRFGLEDGASRTIRQVAEELGIPYSTAKHLLFTALTKMRKPHVAMALRDYLADTHD
jgi:RNA polymerase sigma factor (sigma-70 family)